MARGSRLALWAGLVALSAALATVVLAVLVPGSKAGADKGGGGHCANSAVGNENGNGNGDGKNGNGHKKSHPGHDICSAADRPELGPSFTSLALTSPSHPAPVAPAKPRASHPTPPPSVASVPASRTTLTVAPSHGQPSVPTQQHPSTVTITAKPATTPRAQLIEPVSYPASHNNSVTLPGTLAAFALAVAGVVAVSGYRRRGVLLGGRRPGPGGAGRHGKPRGRHSRR